MSVKLRTLVEASSEGWSVGWVVGESWGTPGCDAEGNMTRGTAYRDQDDVRIFIYDA